MYGLQLVGPQPRFALGNKSSKVLLLNQLSICDFGFFNGSLGLEHDLGGGLPYFRQAGHSNAALFMQIPAHKLCYEVIHVVRTYNFPEN